jgi:exopolysaccharide biosynthesis protein
MLRRIGYTLVVAAVFSLAAWESGRSVREQPHVQTHLVRPGVLHKTIQDPAGPWVIHAVEIDTRRKDLEIQTATAWDRTQGRETTSSMAARKSDSAHHVVAAINGDFFNVETGESNGDQIINGTFVKGSAKRNPTDSLYRSIEAFFAVTENRQPVIGWFDFDGRLFLRSAGVSEITAVNVTKWNGLVLYNSYYSRATPRRTTGIGVAEVSLRTVGQRRDSVVCVVATNVRAGGGSTPDEGMLILAAYGDSRKVIEGSVGPGDTVLVVLRLLPDKGRVKNLMAGWPLLVSEGKNLMEKEELQQIGGPNFTERRHPRTGVGISKDKAKVFFITVDGRQVSSAGMTMKEFADAMISLGVHTGLNLDGGGSTTLVVNGKVANSPSDRTGERPVANALLVVAK